MTTQIVIDASAGVELLARTELGLRCQQLLPHDVVPWVPDGLFDTEVFAVLRRWDLRAAGSLQIRLAEAGHGEAETVRRLGR